MAKTLISDVIVPEIFEDYSLERTTEKTEIIASGIVETSPEYDAKASQGGTTVQMPFWQDLTGDDVTVEEDTTMTPGNISTDKDICRQQARRRAWGAGDLAGILAGDDPMARIGDLVGDYQSRRLQATLISTLKGVFSASSMSTNLLDIHSQAGTPGSSNYLTIESAIKATQKMGDHKDRLTAIVMHSATEAHLALLDLIDYERDSQGNDRIPVFMGKRVIVDDTVPTATVGGKTVYWTFFFGQGAIALGFDRQKAMEAVDGGYGTWGTEIDRDAFKGDTFLIKRWKFIMHPRGVKWTDASVAGSYPTNAELENGNNWTRVYEQQNIRIVACYHNIQDLD
jgi:hypothetical protein